MSHDLLDRIEDALFLGETPSLSTAIEWEDYAAHGWHRPVDTGRKFSICFAVDRRACMTIARRFFAASEIRDVWTSFDELAVAVAAENYYTVAVEGSYDGQKSIVARLLDPLSPPLEYFEYTRSLGLMRLAINRMTLAPYRTWVDHVPPCPSISEIISASRWITGLVRRR